MVLIDSLPVLVSSCLCSRSDSLRACVIVVLAMLAAGIGAVCVPVRLPPVPVSVTINQPSTANHARFVIRLSVSVNGSGFQRYHQRTRIPVPPLAGHPVNHQHTNRQPQMISGCCSVCWLSFILSTISISTDNRESCPACCSV